MKTKRFLLVTLALLIITTGLIPDTAGSRVYHERTGEKVDVHSFTITGTKAGYTVLLTTEKEQQNITQTFYLNSKMETLKWEYHNPSKNTKIKATLMEQKIYMFATDKGKGVEKVFDIGDYPWNQTFNIGLEPFTQSTQKSIKFYAVGVGGPGNMKCTKFKAKRKKVETITLAANNEPVEAVHITISLSGILSIFWTGKYWYRKSDGKFLRYRGKNKRGAPVSVMELQPSGTGTL